MLSPFDHTHTLLEQRKGFLLSLSLMISCRSRTTILRKLLLSRKSLHPVCLLRPRTQSQAQALISSSDESLQKETTVATKAIRLKRHRKRNQSERERLYSHLGRMFELQDYPWVQCRPRYRMSVLFCHFSNVTNKSTSEPKGTPTS